MPFWRQKPTGDCRLSLPLVTEKPRHVILQCDSPNFLLMKTSLRRARGNIFIVLLRKCVSVVELKPKWLLWSYSFPHLFLTKKTGL